jgi:peptidoglycan/xylan/chitin deacetylase (PgdA/CDA1 family)
MSFKIKLAVIILTSLFSCNNGKRGQAGLCISFDDRSVEQWFEMRTLLNKYNAKVTFFVTQFDTLTASEIRMLKALQDDGHEIGSHGMLHVSSESYINENSYEAYLKNEIDPAISAMNNAGFHPRSFAYPYGAKYWFTDLLLSKKFKVLRGVTAMNAEKDITRINEIYYAFNNDRTLSAMGIDVNSGLTKKIFRDGIRRALDKNEVLLLYGHFPSDNAVKIPYSFDINFLEFILIEAGKHNLKYYTMRELVD